MRTIFKVVNKVVKPISGVATLAIAALVAIAPPTMANETELVWSVHSDQSGPASYDGKYQAEAFTDYVHWKNERGGIEGRKIRLILNDTQFDPTTAMAGLRRVLSTEKPVYIFGDGTAMTRVFSPENNSQHHILMSSGSFASEFDDTTAFPYNFIGGASYGDQQIMLIDYIKSSHKGSEAPRVGFVHSNTGWGRDGVEQAVEYAREAGLTVDLVQQTRLVETDVVPYVLSIRRAKLDYVIFTGYQFSVWPEIIRLSQEYGLKTQFLGQHWAMDRTAISDIGEIANGYIGVSPYVFNTTDAEHEVLQAIDTIQRSKNPNYTGYPPMGYMHGWFSAMMATKAIEMTLAKGQPLTGENLADNLRSVRAWDTGLIGTPVNITGQKAGYGRIYRWNGADNWKPEPVSEWMAIE